MGLDPYNAHQQNYMKHVYMREAHCHNYYKNREFSIASPLEDMTIIYNKMNHAKTACMCFAHEDKAMDSLLRFHVYVTCTIQCFLFKICVVESGCTKNLLVMFNKFDNCLENGKLAIWPKLLGLVTNAIVPFNILKVSLCLGLKV